MKVSIIAITKSTTSDDGSFCKEVPELYRESEGTIPFEASVFAGRNSGICYMKEDYFATKAHDISDCLKRAKYNAQSGHYSVFGHYYITFLLEEVPKIIAMTLNNIITYNTSEKSARYTKMKPESDLEIELYDKWQNKFEGIINAYDFGDSKKLAQENARYMISVFTPTTMSYTIPYNRLLLLLKWIYTFTNIDMMHIGIGLPFNANKCINKFFTRYSEELGILRKELMKAANIKEGDLILHEHKGMGINLFGELYTSLYRDDCDSISVCKPRSEMNSYYGNVYESIYNASFACIAQLQRHRTLNYSIRFLDGQSFKYYIPGLIKNTVLEKEWINDMNKLTQENIVIQGILMNVVEQGTFTNFVLKTKERLCARAQYEIMEITKMQAMKFYENRDKLNSYNEDIITNIVKSYEVKPRCRFHGYVCLEPCSLGERGLIRNY